MNCKPGDLAVVTNVTSPEGEPYLGLLVEVLYAQPFHRFQLPDGFMHEPASEPNRWVVKILGAPVKAPLVNGGHRLARYATAGDARLRPLRGLPQDERHDEEITRVIVSRPQRGTTKL